MLLKYIAYPTFKARERERERENLITLRRYRMQATVRQKISRLILYNYVRK